MQILIVDENKAVSISLKNFLTKIGHDVTNYCYIEEMVARLPSPSIPEVALLDVNIDNMEYRRALQDFHRYYPEALIVIMTENRMIMPTKDAIKCGIQSFLHKPFDFHELELLLLRSLERNNHKPDKRRYTNETR